MRLQSLVAISCLILNLVVAGCAAKSDTAEDHLTRGMKNLAASEFQKAEKEFQQVLRMDGSNKKAIRELGLLYYGQGQLRQAFPLLKKSDELSPDDVDVQVKLALTYFTGRDFQNARDLAQQILEKDGTQEDAILLVSDTARTPQELEAARRFFEDHIKDHRSAAYHLAIGALELHQQKFPAAETELKAALQINPKSVAANLALGNLYLAQQNSKAAGEFFKKAADLSPPRAPAKLRYLDFALRNDPATAKQMIEEIAGQSPEFLPIRVYLMRIACSEKKEDCSNKVDGVLAQDPLNYDALFQSGILSLQKRDTARAIRIFSQLTSLNDRDARARYELALAYLASVPNASTVDARNATDTAENNLNLARQLDPRLTDAALLLAELKIRKGSASAAVEVLQPVIKDQPQLAKAQYLLGAAYVAQQKSAEAAAVYEKMVENFPKEPEPSVLLARILVAEKKPAEARKALEHALQISQTYLPAAELLVDMDLADKQFQAALQRVQPLIDKDPKAAAPLAIRGKIYATQGDLTRAEADVAKAVELAPNLEPAQMLLAQIDVGLNKPEKAAEELKNFAAKSKSIAAYQQLAGIYLRQNKVNEARDAYEEVLKLAPNASLAMNNLAVLYADRLGQLDAAQKLANRAREITPNEPHIADTIGWIAFKRGDYQNALREIKDSAARLPAAEVQYHLGMTYYMLGDEQAAQTALQKAVSADFPQKSDAQQRLELLSLKADAAAKPQLEKLLVEKPNDPVVLSRLAAIETSEGRLDEAKAKLEKVVDQNPQFAPATRQLAIVYWKSSGQDPKAYDVVRKARQAYPDDAEIAKILGILNFRRGLAPQSLELLKQAAEKRKDDPELLYYLAEDYRQTKDYDACKDTMQRALSLSLPAELTEQAKKAVAECSGTSESPQ